MRHFPLCDACNLCHKPVIGKERRKGLEAVATILHPDNKGQFENVPVCCNVHTNLWLYILSAHQYGPLDKNIPHSGYYFSIALITVMDSKTEITIVLIPDQNKNSNCNFLQNVLITWVTVRIFGLEQTQPMCSCIYSPQPDWASLVLTQTLEINLNWSLHNYVITVLFTSHQWSLSPVSDWHYLCWSCCCIKSKNRGCWLPYRLMSC